MARKNTLTRFVSDILDDTKDLVDDLVDRAKDVEDDVRGAAKDLVDDDGLDGTPTHVELADLRAAISDLTAQVNQLAGAKR